MPRRNRGGGREDGSGGGRGRGQQIGSRDGRRVGGGYQRRTGPQDESGLRGGTKYCIKNEDRG